MPREIEEVAAEVREHYDADLILYYGPVVRPYDDFLIDECAKKKKRSNALLLLHTFGGDAHAAFRIARAFQNAYTGGKFIVSVGSFCSSAGTLLACGADKLIVSPHAQFGPLDVQMRKADEVGEHTSGLTPVQALDYLASQSLQVFKKHFHSLCFDPDLYFPTSLASRLASEMTTALIGKLYEQIDPLRVAEIYRRLIIAKEYGKRIARNVKGDAVSKLLLDYPSHDFVIDPVEARELFEDVEEPIASLQELIAMQEPHSEKLLYADQPLTCYLEEPTDNAPKSESENGTSETSHAHSSTHQDKRTSRPQRAVVKD